jgi:hypothetical protein
VACLFEEIANREQQFPITISRNLKEHSVAHGASPKYPAFPSWGASEVTLLPFATSRQANVQVQDIRPPRR